MNCLDFRRDALAQPLRLGEPAQAHARDCPACREFLERQRQLDAQLYEMLCVPTPDGLADRILLTGESARGRRRFAALASIAATLVLAAGVAVLGVPMFAGDALAREAIAHVTEEPQAFRMVSRVDPGLLPAELAAQGLQLGVALGEVTYAKLCPMGPGMARHVVIATAGGPVTLLLIPGDATIRRRATVDAAGMTSIAVPATRGSIAIVAADRAAALAVERALVLA